jgi:Cu-processing system permease protein
LNIFSSEDVRAFYGLATIMPNMLTNAGLLGAAMLAWIVAPLGIAVWRFK